MLFLFFLLPLSAFSVEILQCFAFGQVWLEFYMAKRFELRQTTTMPSNWPTHKYVSLSRSSGWCLTFSLVLGRVLWLDGFCRAQQIVTDCFSALLLIYVPIEINKLVTFVAPQTGQFDPIGDRKWASSENIHSQFVAADWWRPKWNEIERKKSANLCTLIKMALIEN